MTDNKIYGFNPEEWKDYLQKIQDIQRERETESWQKRTPAPHQPQPCPRCGYCPHCGRGGHPFHNPFVTY